MVVDKLVDEYAELRVAEIQQALRLTDNAIRTYQGLLVRSANSVPCLIGLGKSDPTAARPVSTVQSGRQLLSVGLNKWPPLIERPDSQGWRSIDRRPTRTTWLKEP